MAKKVLIITYYWPPVGGSGVQRWLKMSRYLSSFGWEPVIYTPENPSFGIVDKSLLADVPKETEIIKLPIWEPYQLFGRFKGKKGALNASDVRIKQKKGWFDKLALWLRGNLFIPDPRIFWVNPSVKFLPQIIALNQIEAVITTGPPHSLHLIGKRLKAKIGIKWIADFRDPWSQWDLYEEFMMTGWAIKKHQTMEKQVLEQSDKVFTINNYYKAQLEGLGGREVDVISNGYDEADFRNFKKKKTSIFTIRHVGIVDEMRDPLSFLTAFEIFVDKHPEQNIRVEFIGNVAETYKESIRNNAKIGKFVTFKSYQPHEEIIRLYEKTDVLLLILTTSKHAIGNTTGKIYEYIASEARILAIGPPKGEVAEILEHTNSGKIAAHDDVEKISELIEEYYQEYIGGQQHKNRHIEEYSRRAQAGKVAEILNSL